MQRKYGKETETPRADEYDYLFVGVSPQGTYGYNYWYVDESKRTKAHTYVWVKMGRHDTEQMVYVDSVRYCQADDVPYPVDRAKRVLRQTTEEERERARALWLGE